MCGELSGCDGIVAAGSFGEDSIEGYVRAAEFARTHDIPYLGICQGMHAAAIEIARNIAGISDAGSEEFNAGEPVVGMIELEDGMELFTDTKKCLKGQRACKLSPDSRLYSIYGDDVIFERHHCLYEVDMKYMDALEKAGINFSAMDPDGKFIEGFELPDRRWFIGVQFDPQYKSRPNRAHPLVASFIENAKLNRNDKR